MCTIEVCAVTPCDRDLMLLEGVGLALADQVEGKFGRDEIWSKTHPVVGLKHIFFVIFCNIFGRRASYNVRAKAMTPGSALFYISITGGVPNIIRIGATKGFSLCNNIMS